jgi:glycosyltransferase involved in cell wall biosynthesis
LNAISKIPETLNDRGRRATCTSATLENKSAIGYLQPIALPELEKNPLVSVLLTGDRSGRFIGAALDSVLAQSYSNLEVIVSHSERSEELGTMLTDRARSDSRIRIVKASSPGDAAAFNITFQESKGAVICLLDGDDQFSPEKLEVLIRRFQGNDRPGMVLHPILITDQNGRQIQQIPFMAKMRDGWIAENLVRRGGRYRYLPTSALSVRRTILESIFPLPAEDFARGADGLILLTAALLTPVGCLKLPLARHSVHQAGGWNPISDHEIAADWNGSLLKTVSTVNERLKAHGITDRILDISDNIDYATQQYCKRLFLPRSRRELVHEYAVIIRRLRSDDLYSTRHKVLAAIAYGTAVMLPLRLRAGCLAHVQGYSRIKNIVESVGSNWKKVFTRSASLVDCWHLSKILEACFEVPHSALADRPPDADAAITAVRTGAQTKGLSVALANNGYRWQQTFAVLPNSSTARWLVPIGTQELPGAALDMYMPYSRVARILKWGLKLSFRIGNWGLREKVVIAATTKPELLSELEAATGQNDLTFAVQRGGVLSSGHITAQLLRQDGQRLGYLKIGTTPDGNRKVQRESAALSLLANTAVSGNVPRVLHDGLVGGRRFLLQDALPGKRGPARFGCAHRKFLAKAAEVSLKFRSSSDLADTLRSRLRSAERLFDHATYASGQRAIDIAEPALTHAEIRCGLVHGDFAPWNTRILNGELYVFDWESMETDLPGVWDSFHFHLQVSHCLRCPLVRSEVFEGLDAGTAFPLFLLYLVWSMSSQQEVGRTHQLTREHRRLLLLQELARY